MSESFITRNFCNQKVFKNLTPYDIINYNLLIECLTRNNYTIFNKLISLIKIFKENKKYKDIDYSKLATDTLKNIIDNQNLRQRTRHQCYSQYDKWTTELLNLGADVQLIIDYYTNDGDETPFTDTLSAYENITIIGCWKWNTESKKLERYWYSRFMNYESRFLQGWIYSKQKHKIYDIDIRNWIFNVTTIYLLVDNKRYVNISKLKYTNFLYALLDFIANDFHIRYQTVPSLFYYAIDETNIDIITNYVTDVYDIIYRLNYNISEKLNQNVIYINTHRFSCWDIEDKYFTHLYRISNKISEFMSKNLSHYSIRSDEKTFTDLYSIKHYNKKKQARKDEITNALLNNYIFLYKDIISVICKFI
jgi:hypothetical protein